MFCDEKSLSVGLTALVGTLFHVAEMCKNAEKCHHPKPSRVCVNESPTAGCVCVCVGDANVAGLRASKLLFQKKYTNFHITAL